MSVPRGRRPRAGVVLRTKEVLPATHCAEVDGIPATTVARTLFDLAGSVHPLRAERALDSCLARKKVELAALWEVLVDLAKRGRTGTVLFRELLHARPPAYVPPESELESRFVELVRAGGLEEPECQVGLGDADGRIGRVDFLYRDAGLVVEVDGRAFHDSLLDRAADRDRDRRLESIGYTVLRVNWEMVVLTPAALARRLAETLVERRAAA